MLSADSTTSLTDSNAGVRRGPTIGDPRVARSLHTTTVVTPEAVLLEFRTAGIASRLLAKGVDLILQLIALYALFIVVLIASGGSDTVAIIMIVVGIFLILFGYPMIEAVWNGQTIGKRIFGVRVITVEGGPIGARHAAIRSLIWIIEFFVPPGGLLAMASALLSRRSQRVGDLAAGTLVIRDSGGVVNPLYFPPAFGNEEFSQRFDSSRMSPHDYTLVREFLSRAHQFTPEARAALAASLTADLVARLEQPCPPWVLPERYLVSAVFAVQQSAARGVSVPPTLASAPPPRGRPAGSGVGPVSSMPPPPPGRRAGS